MTTERVQQREKNWDRSTITPAIRSKRYSQRATLVLICGAIGQGKTKLAKALEEDLFASNRAVYYLGLSNSLLGVNMDLTELGERDEYIRRLGETSHLFTDAGLILITTISDLDDYELEMVNTLNQPNDCLVVNVGANRFNHAKVDLQLDKLDDLPEAVMKIKNLLKEEKYLIEYYL